MKLLLTLMHQMPESWRAQNNEQSLPALRCALHLTIPHASLHPFFGAACHKPFYHSISVDPQRAVMRRQEGLGHLSLLVLQSSTSIRAPMQLLASYLKLIQGHEVVCSLLT